MLSEVLGHKRIVNVTAVPGSLQGFSSRDKGNVGKKNCPFNPKLPSVLHLNSLSFQIKKKKIGLMISDRTKIDIYIKKRV